MRWTTLRPDPDRFSAARALASTPECWAGLLDAGAPLPPSVTSWLACLSLLEGVPFNYLVPDDRLLPSESIRFFHVDPNWVAAVRDGALSIGRTTSFDQAHDDGVAAVASAVAAERAASERARRLHSEAPAATAAHEQTGVLLRSELVEGWPGLELRAYEDADAQTLIPTAHQTLLSPSVMICIFDGVLGRLDIQEPQEGVLFGADPDGKGGYQRGLRGLDQGGFDLGVPIDGAKPVALPPRAGAKPGVLDVAAAANGLHDGLVDARAWTAGDALDAADFAIEMIEAPQHVALVLQPATRAPERARRRRAQELVERGARALDAALVPELADD